MDNIFAYVRCYTLSRIKFGDFISKQPMVWASRGFGWQRHLFSDDLSLILHKKRPDSLKLSSHHKMSPPINKNLKFMALASLG